MQSCAQILKSSLPAAVAAAFFLIFLNEPQAADIESATIRGGWEAAVSENNRVTTILRGEEINGSRITQLSIQLNKEGAQSTPEFFIESTECNMPYLSEGNYDASSAKKIILRTADGGFIIEGVGWKWSQSQSLLVISNKVSTTIKKNLIGAGRKKAVSYTHLTLPTILLV